MKPVLLTLAIIMASCAPAAVVTAPAATADPVNQGGDSPISVKPGRYMWKQKAEAAGGLYKSHEENIECLIPEKANTTVSKLVRTLGKTCTASNVSPTATGYNFKLTCSGGKLPGAADASVVYSETSMTIEAKGSATVVGVVPVGFQLRADANRVDNCSDAEIAKAKASWAKKGG